MVPPKEPQLSSLRGEKPTVLIPLMRPRPRITRPPPTPRAVFQARHNPGDSALGHRGEKKGQKSMCLVEDYSSKATNPKVVPDRSQIVVMLGEDPASSPMESFTCCVALAPLLNIAEPRSPHPQAGAVTDPTSQALLSIRDSMGRRARSTARHTSTRPWQVPLSRLFFQSILYKQ